MEKEMGNMQNPINSSELAEQISDVLKLNQEENKELYNELSQIQNGAVKNALHHMMKLLKPELNALTGKKCFTEHKPVMHTYVACICGCSVRDAQYEKTACSDHLDDDAWVDAHEMPLFLEIVKAETPTRAKQIAAFHYKVNENVIELFPV